MAVEERAEKVVARVMAAAAMVRVVVAKARVVVVRVVAAEAKVTVAREAGACETRGAPAHHAEIQTDGGDNVQQWLQDNPSHAMASQSLALCYSNRHRACLPATSLVEKRPRCWRSEREPFWRLMFHFNVRALIERNACSKNCARAPHPSTFSQAVSYFTVPALTPGRDREIND